MFLSVLLFVCIFPSFANSKSAVNISNSPPLLLLISFDGFRYDYPDIYTLKTFHSLLDRGIRAKWINNSFVTTTFPNHFTIATGLFEETHGVVSNDMYDPVLNLSTTLVRMNDTKWWSQNSYTQPIWVTNELQNNTSAGEVKRKSGVIGWPSTGIPINGYAAFKNELYDESRKFETVIDQIIEWFKDPNDPINFGAIYYFQPDRTGHIYGPNSSQMNITLQDCDRLLAYLLDKIDKDLYLNESLNVILTSDHGMTEVDEKHVLNLDDYIDQNLYSVYGGISQVNIFLTPDANIDEIYKKLSNNLNYEVYKKDSIPKEYHYKNNVRIGDIMIVGKPGYTIVSSNTNVNWTFHHGDHGYSNIEPTMHPIFYAWGPAFKKSLNSEPFRNVDIYPLMCYVLNIPIRPTNGSIDNVKHLLKNYKSSSFLQQLILPANQAIPIVIIVLISVTIAIVYSIVSCGHAKKTVIIQKYVPIHYQLLGNNDDKKYTNNLVISDDDEG